MAIAQHILHRYHTRPTCIHKQICLIEKNRIMSVDSRCPLPDQATCTRKQKSLIHNQYGKICNCNVIAIMLILYEIYRLFALFIQLESKFANILDYLKLSHKWDSTYCITGYFRQTQYNFMMLMLSFDDFFAVNMINFFKQVNLSMILYTMLLKTLMWYIYVSRIAVFALLTLIVKHHLYSESGPLTHLL